MLPLDIATLHKGKIIRQNALCSTHWPAVVSVSTVELSAGCTAGRVGGEEGTCVKCQHSSHSALSY